MVLFFIQKKCRRQSKPAAFSGAPEGIRIPGLPLRRRTLYPAELRAHIAPGISANEYARHVVPVVGLEPTRCCHQRILSPHRLPFRHTGIGYSCYIITYFSPVRKSFFPGAVHSLMLLHTGAQRPVFKGGALCIFQVLSS